MYHQLPLVVDLNTYKADWYRQVSSINPEKVIQVVDRTSKRSKSYPTSKYAQYRSATSSPYGKAAIAAVHTAAEKGIAKGGAYAIAGSGAKLGLRFVPVVGYALLAYDVYRLGKWILED